MMEMTPPLPPSSSSTVQRHDDDDDDVPTQNNDDYLYDGRQDGMRNGETSPSSSSSTLPLDWTVEICICFLPLLFGILLEYLQLPPNERPIPYQYLQRQQQQDQDDNNNNNNNDEVDGGGQFILNQVYNEILSGTASQGGETVTSAQLILYSVVVPFIIQLSLSCYQHHHRHNRHNHSRRCCGGGGERRQHPNDQQHQDGEFSYLDSSTVQYRTVCVYFVAIGTVIATTNAIKLYVGYLRPVFYDVCQPEQVQQQATEQQQEDNNNDPYYLVCSDDDNAREARLSFPSGHASISVCGLLLLSQFLEQQCFGQTAYHYYYYSRLQNGPPRQWNNNNNNNTHPSGGEQPYDDSSSIDEGNQPHHHHQQRLLGNIDNNDDEVTTTDSFRHTPLSLSSSSPPPPPQQQQHLHNRSAHTSSSSLSSPPGRRRRRRRKRQLYRRFIRIISMLCYSPMLLALFIASSRVHDNKHFPADVVGGSLLGGSVAVLVHGIWFPPPTTRW